MTYSFDFDRGTGILRAKPSGHWTLPVAKRYCDELARHVAEARRTTGMLRLLLDFAEFGVQQADVVGELADGHRLLAFTSDDWIAVCAPPGINRGYAERCDAIARTEFFSTVGAARVWLMNRNTTHATAA